MKAVPIAAHTALQRHHNAETADAWPLFASHRERLTALVAEQARPRGGRLLVLGAGNCNDLDLGRLALDFDQIALADIDGEALRRALKRQTAAVQSKLRLLPTMDLSAGLLSRPSLPGTDREIRQLAETAVSALLPRLAGPYDVVLSACMLTQLMHACHVGVRSGRTHKEGLGAAIASAHVLGMTRALAPGGTAILATDVVSSDTYPVEELYASKEPNQLLEEVIHNGANFAGTSPAFVGAILRAAPGRTGAFDRPRLVSPWLWRFSVERSYLVYAITWRA